MAEKLTAVKAGYFTLTIVAIIAPQYFDAGFKGTLRHLASLSGKKVTFIELDQICDLIFMNETISIS